MQDPLSSAFAKNLVQSLVGNGAHIVPGSIVVSGSPRQIGLYSITGPNAAIPFSKGLILSTSEVKYISSADNPDEPLSRALDPQEPSDPGDPFMNQKLNVSNTMDAITLQFSFKPKSDRIVFRYAIATEEYPTFVSSDYRDVFGFFASGPKPSGGSYDDLNLAILPDNQVASIYNIFNNSSYFINTQGNKIHQFNGVSTAFACTLEVIPCSVYTIKLKICDVNDERFDSAVFLEANRFGSPTASFQVNTESNDSTAMEGCNPIQLILTKNDSKFLNQSITVQLKTGGTATSGQDYSPVPPFMTIPAGKLSDTLNVNIIDDDVNEPIETLKIYYAESCGIYDSATVKIIPRPRMNLTSSSSIAKCSGSGPVQLSATASGGVLPYSYFWSNGNTGSIIAVDPPQTTTYSVIAKDKCNGKDSAKVTVVIFSNNQPPPVNGKTIVCSGSDLIIESTLNAEKYYWTGPNGWTANTKAINIKGVNPSFSGTYTLQIETNNCKSAINSFSVYIVDPGIAPPISSNGPICESNQLRLNSNIGPDGNFNWKGPGGFFSSMANPTITNVQINNSGEYSFFVVAGSCTSATSKITVDIRKGLEAKAGSNITICSKDTLQIGSSPQAGITYSWLVSTGLISSNVSNPFFTYENKGIVDLTIPLVLKATGNGCERTDSISVKVVAMPNIDFDQPNNQCFDGHSFDFNSNGKLPVSALYEWDFGPGASPRNSKEEKPKGVRYDNPGIKQVSLLINNQGCRGEKITREFNILEMPDADFDASSFSGCAPLSVNFITSSKGGVFHPRTIFEWDFGNGTVSSIKEPKVIYTNPGTFDVKLTVKNELNCADVITKKAFISVSSRPVSSFEVTPKLVRFDNPTVLVNNTSQSSDNCKYNISGKNGLIDFLDSCDGKYVFKDTGSFTIQQIKYGSNGCSDTSVKVIKVVPDFKVFIPSCFTPDVDNLNDFFKIFGEGFNQFYLRIYDQWGHLLYQSYDVDNGWDGKISLNDRIVHGDIFYYKLEVTDIFNEFHQFDGWLKALK